MSLKREDLSTKIIKTITFNDNHIPFEEPVHSTTYQQSLIELIEPDYTIETAMDDVEPVEEDDHENTSDEITHNQYVIISANPSFHMTENLFTIIANNVNAEYTESENTNENEDDSDYDEPDEVVIEDSSQNDESDEENESDGDEVI